MEYDINNVFSSDFLDSIDGFEITKLPNELNPDILLDKRMREIYASKCPYCGNKDEYNVVYNWRGIEIRSSMEHHRINGEWWQIWKPSHQCRKLQMICHKCGTEWESPWYPQDINNQCLK